MKQTKLYSILFAVMFISTATWAGKARLISIDVMQKIGDSIKTTGEYSEEIEVELADVVETLDSNMKFYEDTGCSSNESVDGCRQAKAKIKENYAKMLNVIKTKLPEMRTALQVASNSVVGELKRNVATKDVPSLQEYLLSQTSGESPVVESKEGTIQKDLMVFV